MNDYSIAYLPSWRLGRVKPERKYCSSRQTKLSLEYCSPLSYCLTLWKLLYHCQSQLPPSSNITKLRELLLQLKVTIHIKWAWFSTHNGNSVNQISIRSFHLSFENRVMVGGSIVAQRVKLPFATPISYVGAGSSPHCSTFNPAPY